jgi:hypothetical protein
MLALVLFSLVYIGFFYAGLESAMDLIFQFMTEQPEAKYSSYNA